MPESITLAPAVLVIDDEPLNRIFVARVLGAAGWRVVAAADGVAGLALLTAELPALVLLDLQMAGMTGLEVAEAIRALGGDAARVPVVAFTTVRLTDPQLLIDKGFDALLAKPCTPDELIAAAARWLPTAALAGPTRLEAVFGAQELDRLLAGFRDELATAVDLLDAPEGAERAHRVAGIAGTLGFPEVSASWLDVSEGDVSAIPRARRDALRALAAIDARS